MPQNLLQRLEETIVSEATRLGRNVEHDIASAKFPVQVSMSAPLKSVTHDRKIPILNQGNLGSCTGNAGTGLIGTEPFYSAVGKTMGTLDEAFAVKLYEDATVVDGFPGVYPPDDTGSSGLAIGKVFKKRGDISSYRHAFGLLHALQAIVLKPVIVGLPWYRSMFEPDNGGKLVVDLNSPLDGGHELEVIAIEVSNPDPNDPQGRLIIPNSWGMSWGNGGYCELDFRDFDQLLKRGGDVMTLAIKGA